MAGAKAGADAFALVSYYEKKYKEKYAVKAVVNRYAARWGFDSILVQLPVSGVKSLIDYYLTTQSPNRHSLDWFFYHYHELMESKAVADKDAEERSERAKESKRRTEEWRKQIAKRTEGS